MARVSLSQHCKPICFARTPVEDEQSILMGQIDSIGFGDDVVTDDLTSFDSGSLSLLVTMEETSFFS
jgi:hypothetical protein